MTLIHRCFVALIALAALCGPAVAAEAAKTAVMLVGTYHLSNPGKDINNVKAVDILTPQRQREIGKVVAALAKFAPTRVAVEWPEQIVNERYAKFRAGQLPESRNEVVQLGFRLAHQRNLATVQGIDVDGDFPFEAVMAWAREHGRAGELDAVMLTMGVDPLGYLADT
jgi:hypothetical protein